MIENFHADNLFLETDSMHRTQNFETNCQLRPKYVQTKWFLRQIIGS